MPVEESTPAIVLRTRDYAEADRIVTLLTRDVGKLSGIAKGAKASRRRFERTQFRQWRKLPHAPSVNEFGSSALKILEIASRLGLRQ